MLVSGLCSISFRKLNTQEIIDLTVRAGLRAIEWGGDVHVPPGSPETAKKVKEMTLQSGLELLSYGSYYRAGESEQEGLSFTQVLASAASLGVSTIRVWAGNQNYEQASPAYRKKVIEDSRRIAHLASEKNIVIAFEWHADTLTNSNEGAFYLSEALPESNIMFYWQPPHGMSDAACLMAITKMRPRICHIHAFHWVQHNGKLERLMLEQGENRWRQFLKTVDQDHKKRGVYLEFSRHNDPANFLKDADCLQNRLLACLPQ